MFRNFRERNSEPKYGGLYLFRVRQTESSIIKKIWKLLLIFLIVHWVLMFFVLKWSKPFFRLIETFHIHPSEYFPLRKQIWNWLLTRNLCSCCMWNILFGKWMRARDEKIMAPDSSIEPKTWLGIRKQKQWNMTMGKLYLLVIKLGAKGRRKKLSIPIGWSLNVLKKYS